GLAVVAEHSCDPFCCRHSDHPPLVWCAPQLQLHYTVHMRTCQHLKSTFFGGQKKLSVLTHPSTLVYTRKCPKLINLSMLLRILARAAPFFSEIAPGNSTKHLTRRKSRGTIMSKPTC